MQHGVSVLASKAPLDKPVGGVSAPPQEEGKDACYDLLLCFVGFE